MPQVVEIAELVQRGLNNMVSGIIIIVLLIACILSTFVSIREYKKKDSKELLILISRISVLWTAYYMIMLLFVIKIMNLY